MFTSKLDEASLTIGPIYPINLQNGMSSFRPDRAKAQAVIRLFPMAARVRSQFRYCGILMDKVTLGKLLPEYFGFPYQFSSNKYSIFIYHEGLVK
jgi:hypothetical protein